MNAGFDLVGQRRKLFQLRTEERVRKDGRVVHNGGGLLATEPADGHGALSKMDGTTHFIKNIVYCRDPSIIDAETLHAN